ncbi:MAG: hypothetical protein U9N87_14990 [Planctomycetota bacterium]|nr:hypothetical protein [Planctomycetota bacterium]
MRDIRSLIGREADLPSVARAIRLCAEEIDVPVAGGYHITCSDESEWECAEIFDQLFAQQMLPRLKMDRAAVFRTMNLGGRYETGAIHIAEEHFATFASRQSAKVMVVKVSSHTAVTRREDGFSYGTLQRYGNDSACCGALVSLTSGGTLPAVAELAETFARDGHDRLAELRDEQLIPPDLRALFTAIVNARLQADRVVEDIRSHMPESPTVFLIIPCVTINRDEPDNELVVGEYGVDATGSELNIKYRGLGSAPLEYRVKFERGLLKITDDQYV